VNAATVRESPDPIAKLKRKMAGWMPDPSSKKTRPRVCLWTLQPIGRSAPCRDDCLHDADAVSASSTCSTRIRTKRARSHASSRTAGREQRWVCRSRCSCCDLHAVSPVGVLNDWPECPRLVGMPWSGQFGSMDAGAEQSRWVRDDPTKLRRCREQRRPPVKGGVVYVDECTTSRPDGFEAIASLRTRARADYFLLPAGRLSLEAGRFGTNGRPGMCSLGQGAADRPGGRAPAPIA
jgi:hypothetical protein